MLHPKRRLPRVDVARAGLVRVLLNLYLVYRNVARRFYLACRCCEILQSDIRRRFSVGLAVQNKNAKLYDIKQASRFGTPLRPDSWQPPITAALFAMAKDSSAREN